MNKKENRMAVRQAAQQAVIRDEQNHRIQYMATNPVREVLKSLPMRRNNPLRNVWREHLSIHLQQSCSAWQSFLS